jgi:hypothetical protein
VKKSIKLLVFAVLLTGLVLPEYISAQSWGGRRKPGIWDNWSINANAGLTSFFGDVSIYDTEIIDKFTKESGPAFGAILSKHFSPKVSVAGQLLYGGFKAENTTGRSFETNFMEYNFQARLNLVNIIWPYNRSNFGFNAYGGLGQFVFNTTAYANTVEGTETIETSTSVPEFVYFMGLGMSYKFNDKLGVTADLALRQAQNDKIDALTKNDNYDYYTHFSIGLTYYIDSFKKGNHYTRGGGNTKGRFPGRLPMRRRR